MTATEVAAAVPAVTLNGRRCVVIDDGNAVAAGIARALTAAGGAVGRIVPGDTADGDDGAVVEACSDFADHDRLAAAIDAVAARLDGLDAVVLAGVSPQARTPLAMAEMTDEHFDAVWELTMRTTLFAFQAAYPHFRNRPERGGRLVAVVPSAATSGAPGYSATAAAAEGQRLLVKSAARCWGESNVTANTVMAATSLVVDGAPDFEYSLAERALGGVGDPEGDLGPVVAFLCSDASRFVTGSTLFCDGGLWMSAP